MMMNDEWRRRYANREKGEIDYKISINRVI